LFTAIEPGGCDHDFRFCRWPVASIYLAISILATDPRESCHGDEHAAGHGGCLSCDLDAALAHLAECP
jgi:hypothetical protein